MGKGLGPKEMGVLKLLQEGGGVLTVAGILGGLFDRASIGAKEYHTICSSLSRRLKALRKRALVRAYRISVAGHNALILSLTTAGAEVAQGIVWEEEEPEP